MILYVNTVTGTVDEVDGDSYLVDTDLLPIEDIEQLNAEELVEIARERGAAEEIAR